MNARHVLPLAVLAALVLAGTAWVGYRAGRDAHAPNTATEAAPVPPSAPKVLYWYDPMVPDQHFDKPGKSPFMDMQLVPKYAEADGAAAPGVRIASGVQQNLGIRTATVIRGALPAGQAATGVVAWDLRAERSLSLPVDPVVELLFVRAPFDAVRAGQPLAALRAPAWSTALAEANALSQSDSAEARALSAAAQGRLRALGLPTGARRGRDGTITLSAPMAGVVSEIGVREGQAVPAGTPMFRINGASSPWIEAALPATAQAGVVPGMAVRVRADSLPGEVLVGRVESLLPQVDAATRTRRARILLDAPEARLAPGEYVQVELQPGGRAEDRLVVPSEAIIEDGRGARVIVLAEGRFVPTVVETGRSGGGRTEILSGLQGGEKVVVSGQFLVDSEANLSAALDRLGAEAK